MKRIFSSLVLFIFLIGCKSTKISSTYIQEPSSAINFFRPGNPNFPMVSVHRGGGEPKGIPENCLESFEFYASKIPSIIECDVVMSKDSILYMMHDNTLERTTTGTGNVYQQPWSYIKTLSLKDNFGNITSYGIPSLEDVLKWGRNRVLFTLDIKRNTPFEKVVQIVRQMKAEEYAVIITYNATDAKKVFDLDPNLMISVGIMKEDDYYRLSNLGIPDRNMVAFIGTNEPRKELIDFLHQKGIVTILGVLGNLDKKAASKGDNIYKDYLNLGVDILSTDRPEAVYSIIKSK